MKALASRYGDAAIGLELGRGAVALIAELCSALDCSGRNDWPATAVASVANVDLPKGVQLDGYVHIGIVGRDGFSDGAVRVDNTFAAANGVGMSLVAGSSSRIPPGIAQLDIGRRLVARTAPGSGAVVTLGADF